MKITSIEAIPVRVPLKKGMSTKTAHGEHVVTEIVIIRIRTDEGIVGWGEATVAVRWTGETSQSCVSLVRTIIEPALLGTNPLAITLARQAMDVALKLNPFTKAGVEMALWDIAGKAAGMPVYQLLGGKVRDTARIKMVVGAFDIPRVRSLAAQFLEWGVTCIKVKTGLVPEEDLARVRAVRELAGPSLPITIDSNCGWTVTTAKQTLRKMADLGVTVAEQPIPPDDPAAMAEVRRDTTIPIMADESVFTLNDAWQLTVARACDILSIYPGKHGGIAGTVEIAHVARAAGLKCAIGSNLELGIGTAAMLHVAAALPEIDSELCPADLIGPLYHEADLLTEPLSLGPAFATVPNGPGLGVNLDEEQLQRYKA
jgi:L-alanine-DL-glutamate epimerase-like enolase superfamily enzyme